MNIWDTNGPELTPERLRPLNYPQTVQIFILLLLWWDIILLNWNHSILLQFFIVISIRCKTLMNFITRMYFLLVSQSNRTALSPIWKLGGFLKFTNSPNGVLINWSQTHQSSSQQQRPILGRMKIAQWLRPWR